MANVHMLLVGIEFRRVRAWPRENGWAHLTGAATSQLRNGCMMANQMACSNRQRWLPMGGLVEEDGRFQCRR